MDTKTFFLLVAKMRAAQRGWCEFHNSDYLKLAFKLEKEVDAEIERTLREALGLKLDN